MADQKDLFDLFQANQHEVDEMPSPQAWQRLEKRLDTHQFEGKRVQLVRRWAAAASVLLVLGASITILVTQQRPQFAELAGYAPSEALHFTDVPTHRLLDYSQSAYIEEGLPTRKLVAGINYFYAEDVRDKTIPSKNNQEQSVRRIQPTKRDFSWIIGTWEGKTAKGISEETWSKVDQNTLHGKGTVEIDGETVFLEQMRLEQRGDSWYYIIQDAYYTKPIVFRLAYYSPEMVVFENTKRQFPNQIVLDRRLEGAFSTILLPKGEIQLHPKQLDFLMQRNVVLQDKAVRNLWKQ